MKKFSEYSIVVAANLICSFVMLVYNVIMRRYVPPYDMGIYTSVNLIILYMGYAHIGVLNSYNRDYPQLLGAREKIKAEKMRNAVFTFLIALYFLITVGSVVAGYLLYNKDFKLFIGVCCAGVISAGNSMFTFFDFTNKSQKKFVKSSVNYLLKTTAIIIIGLITISQFGYIGIYSGLLAGVVVTIIINADIIKEIRFNFDIKLTCSLVASGLMLLVNNFVWTLMQSVDRLVILKFLNMEQLGVYSVALLGFSTMVIFPQSLAQVFYVKLSRKYGNQKDENILFKDTAKFTKIIASITTIVTVFAYYLLPIFISYCMPMYKDCVKSSQFILLGVSLYGGTLLFGNVLSVLKKNSVLIISTIVLCALNLVLSSIAVILSPKIESVAIATSISYGIYALILLAVTLREHRTIFIESVFSIILPSICTIVAIVIISNFLNGLMLQFIISLIFVFGLNAVQNRKMLKSMFTYFRK